MVARDGQFDGVELVDVVVRADVDPAAIERLADKINFLLEPTGADAAARLLGKLAALTTRRAHGEIGEAMAAAAYAERLGEYPHDVAQRACDAWADRETWWPAWAELRAECDRLMRGRQAVRRALQSWRS